MQAPDIQIAEIARRCSLQEKLREVPAYEDSASLHADIESLRPPAWLRDVLHSALHTIPAPILDMPSAAPSLAAPATTAAAQPESTPDALEGGGEDTKDGHGRVEAARKVDPWFLDGGFAACRVAAGQGNAPQWLRGAVRRRPA